MLNSREVLMLMAGNVGSSNGLGTQIKRLG